MEAVLKTSFNDAQVELLQMFASGLSDKQLQDLRQVLIAFKFRLLDEHVEKVIAEKGITDEQINNASFEHLRTPYRSKQRYFERLSKENNESSH